MGWNRQRRQRRWLCGAARYCNLRNRGVPCGTVAFDILKLESWRVEYNSSGLPVGTLLTCLAPHGGAYGVKQAERAEQLGFMRGGQSERAASKQRRKPGSKKERKLAASAMRRKGAQQKRRAV